jgi:hypothetical protein
MKSEERKGRRSFPSGRLLPANGCLFANKGLTVATGFLSNSYRQLGTAYCFMVQSDPDTHPRGKALTISAWTKLSLTH